MKTIKLTESQLNLIFEANDSEAPNFNGGDLKSYNNGSEVTTTPNVTKNAGDEEYGKPLDTDKIQKMLAIQNYWANAHNGARVMP